MGFLKSGEELRQEGKNCFEAKDYARALRCFEKAFEKGDHDSLYLIYESHKKLNQIDAGIHILQQNINTPEFSTAEKVRICKLLAQNDHLRVQYLEYAANLGDIISQNSLFQTACTNSDLSAVLYYGEQILNNTSATEEIKTAVYQQFLNRVKHEDTLGNNYYAFVNGSLGDHTYLSLLHDVINRSPSKLNILAQESRQSTE